MTSNGRPEPPPARGSQRARTVDFNGASTLGSMSSSSTSLHQGGLTAAQNPMSRKLNAPLYPGHAAQILNTDGARDPVSDLRRTNSGASAHSLPSLPYRPTPPTASQNPTANKPQVLRKPGPPPIPNKKPSLLSNTISPSVTPAPRYRDEPSPEAERRPQPPPPRRSMATPNSSARKPVQNLIDGDEKPPLPPRTGTGLSSASNGSNGGRGGIGSRNLMDDEPEEMQSLKDWEVLRPVR